MLKLERAATTAAHWREEDYQRIFERQGMRRIALVVQGSEQPSAFIVVSVTADTWEIENVVVAAQSRRRGLGSGLVRALIEEAQRCGARAILLEVRESNGPARAMYEKLRFELTGRRRCYYNNPAEDGLLYSLKLTADQAD